MTDTERVIGALEEFKRNTAVRLDRIEKRIERLNEFKWKVAGGAAVLSVLLSASLEILHIYLR